MERDSSARVPCALGRNDRTMPLVLKSDPDQCKPEHIAAAGAILSQGGLVVFPTETVYGIGADIRNPGGVEKVIRLKHRPAGLPVLAHCSDMSQLAGLVAEIPESAQTLIDRFWPGPLALVFRKSKSVPAVVSGPTDTIGIRMVAHPVACQLIAKLGAPLAGTSANLHGEPAISSFDAINPELLKQVDVALDAGTCGQAKPSTILDVTCQPPRLLRPGAVPLARIETRLGYRLRTSTG